MTTALPALFGLLGHPLGHTLSPRIQQAALDACGVAGRYVALSVPPDRLAAAITGVRGFRMQGLNVTIPHKVTVMPLLDGVTPLAQAIGAVNTLYWEGRQLMGDNTDYAGFLASLPAGAATGREVLVLGAGGAARAVALALKSAGAIAVHVVARRAGAAMALRNELLTGVDGLALGDDEEPELEDLAARVGLVVNATPLGTHGAGCPLKAGVIKRLPADARVMDLVYRPAETPLLALARRHGLAAENGREMLVRQAAASFQHWTGLTAPLDVMRQAMADEA